VAPLSLRTSLQSSGMRCAQSTQCYSPLLMQPRDRAQLLDFNSRVPLWFGLRSAAYSKRAGSLSPNFCRGNDSYGRCAAALRQGRRYLEDDNKNALAELLGGPCEHA
jgi:hypothetical protein